MAVTNADDTAGIIVTPTAGLTTTEAGGTVTFTVRLNSQPTAVVTIGLSSGNPAEGTASPATLTFTPANFAIPQAVTVTGTDDPEDDGDVASTIVTAPASSADPNYNNLNAADVAVTNTDDDTAGITVTPVAGLTTTEAGGTATFTVRLNSRPTAEVTIALSSSNPGEGSVAPATLTFTPANFSSPQTVTVTGVDDAEADGRTTSTILTAPAASTDPGYNGLNAADVAVDNDDNDTAEGTFVGMTVQRGTAQRSFIRFVSLNFTQGAGLAAIVATATDGVGPNDRIRLVYRGFDGTRATILPIGAVIRAVDQAIELDFGPQGISILSRGGNYSRVGDGTYEVLLDLDNNGSLETSSRFWRLKGDVAGPGGVADQRVTRADLRAIRIARGTRGTNLQADVNGSGAVNRMDWWLARTSLGRRAFGALSPAGEAPRSQRLPARRPARPAPLRLSLP